MENTEVENIHEELKLKREILCVTDKDPSTYGYRKDFEKNLYVEFRYGPTKFCTMDFGRFIKLNFHDSEEQGFDFEISKDKFKRRRNKYQNSFYQIQNITELRMRADRSNQNLWFRYLGLGALKMVSKVTKQLTFSSIKFSSKSLSLLFTSIVDLKNLNLEQCTLDLSHLRLPIKREIGLEAMTIWECFFTQDEPKMSMEDLEILLKFLANHQFGKLRLLTLQNHHFGFFDLKKSMIKCLGITSKLKVDIPKPKKFGHNAFGCVVF
ncbi:unnamed protein product [Moneuplotes crassus]|uniref:Uncharacterized protein n=1 Tax=Euplotes crassus TaxID=5936 RepID=A0AAD1XHQ6_EUPCR|nr:unnamed protein product [Moneuplotes crassus]